MAFAARSGRVPGEPDVIAEVRHPLIGRSRQLTRGPPPSDNGSQGGGLEEALHHAQAADERGGVVGVAERLMNHSRSAPFVQGHAPAAFGLAQRRVDGNCRVPGQSHERGRGCVVRAGEDPWQEVELHVWLRQVRTGLGERHSLHRGRAQWARPVPEELGEVARQIDRAGFAVERRHVDQTTD